MRKNVLINDTNLDRELCKLVPGLPVRLARTSLGLDGEFQVKTAGIIKVPTTRNGRTVALAYVGAVLVDADGTEHVLGRLGMDEYTVGSFTDTATPKTQILTGTPVD